MTTVRELASLVRSKNAGPFWLTIDVFFDDPSKFERARNSPLTDPKILGTIYAVNPQLVRVFELPLLQAIKVSVPRPTVQGSVGDRDMHAGQQYVAILDLAVDADAAKQPQWTAGEVS